MMGSAQASATTPSPTYSPILAAPYWSSIEPFVVSAVADAEPYTTYSAKKLFAAVGPLTLWAWQTAGLPLSRSAIFSVSTIERFAAHGMKQYKPAGRGSMRSRLLRVSEVLTGEYAIPGDLRPYGRSDAARPYTSKEQAAFTSWAATQGTALRRANAAVLMSLGFGAGLSNREIVSAKIQDLALAGRYVIVCVGGERTRVVPVLTEWDLPLRWALESADADRHVFLPGRTYRSPNVPGLFVSTADGGRQLQVQRMRATWIVHHLEAGTPALALMRAAGLRSPEALDRYLPFASEPNLSDYIEAVAVPRFNLESATT